MKNIKHRFNDTFFDIIDTEEKAYWLGFIVADGHIDKNGYAVTIELSKVDEDHLKKLAGIFQKDLKYRSRKLKGRDTVYHQCCLYIGGSGVNKSLRKLGLTNKKSEQLNGEVLKSIPSILFHHFIRGFFDGDGTIVKGRMFLYGNMEFLSCLKSELESRIGIRFDITKNRSIFALYVCSAYSVFKFREYIYKNSTIFLQRKFDKFVDKPPVFSSKYRFIHKSSNGYWYVVKKQKNKTVINKGFKTEDEAADFAISCGLDIDRNSTSYRKWDKNEA